MLHVVALSKNLLISVVMTLLVLHISAMTATTTITTTIKFNGAQ